MREARSDWSKEGDGVTITRVGRVGGPIGPRVPKRDLAPGLRAPFESGEIRMAQGLRESGRLVEELTNMRSRLEGPGREAFGAAKRGVHDDLAMALALAVWAGRRGKVGEMGKRLL